MIGVLGLGAGELVIILAFLLLFGLLLVGGAAVALFVVWFCSAIFGVSPNLKRGVLEQAGSFDGVLPSKDL